MADSVPPVGLASLAAGGNHPGTRWRLDGEELQANLVWLGRGNRIQPHRNDEVEVLVVVVLGRGELTLDGQVHQLAPGVVARTEAVQGGAGWCGAVSVRQTLATLKGRQPPWRSTLPTWPRASVPSVPLIQSAA